METNRIENWKCFGQVVWQLFCSILTLEKARPSIYVLKLLCGLWHDRTAAWIFLQSLILFTFINMCLRLWFGFEDWTGPVNLRLLCNWELPGFEACPCQVINHFTSSNIPLEFSTAIKVTLVWLVAMPFKAWFKPSWRSPKQSNCKMSETAHIQSSRPGFVSCQEENAFTYMCTAVYKAICMLVRDRKCISGAVQMSWVTPPACSNTARLSRLRMLAYSEDILCQVQYKMTKNITFPGGTILYIYT